VSRAKQLIQENDLKREVLGGADDFEWRQALAPALEDARQFYKRLESQGVIRMLRTSKRRGSISTGLPENAIAEAVLRMSLEDRMSPGAERAYKMIMKEAL